MLHLFLKSYFCVFFTKQMDGNPIRSTGVVLIVSAVNNKSDTAIRELHFKVSN